MLYSINRDQVLWNTVDGEVVLIHSETTYYYGLNKTGTLIWELLSERERTADELTQRVAAHFGSDEASVRPDVMEFISQMLGENLITAR